MEFIHADFLIILDYQRRLRKQFLYIGSSVRIITKKTHLHHLLIHKKREMFGKCYFTKR